MTEQRRFNKGPAIFRFDSTLREMGVDLPEFESVTNDAVKLARQVVFVFTSSIDAENTPNNYDIAETKGVGMEQ